MLTITIPSKELYDEKENKVYKINGQKIDLEHSLFSISKWEEKYKKPFMSTDKKTLEETIDYIKYMCLTKVDDDRLFLCLTKENIDEINLYMTDKHTATTINKKNIKTSRKIITAEVVYYWMIQHEIPFECQYWNFNKLTTLIEVCGEEENKKPMSKKDILRQQQALNRMRRK